MAGPSFRIQKWYFDAADSNGNLLIGYAGKLKWNRISFSFSSILKKVSGKETTTTSSLRHTELPLAKQRELHYRNPMFEVNLKGIAAPITEMLIETPSGKIEWNCYFPSCSSEIKIEELKVGGTGYAEELIITIKPWEFKIQELYWGRFVSGETYITWIEWKGEWKRFSIWYNGKKFEIGKITEKGVEFSEGKLEFEEISVLRSGSLLSTVFKRFPLFKKLFPLKALLIDESKWFAKGKFRIGNETLEGYCVYEKVKWL